MKLINRTELYNGTGYVEHWDLSMSNISEESRIDTITEIAKVCRNLTEIKDKHKLYNHLLTEHAGKPGEIFQFIPVTTRPDIGMNVYKWGVFEKYADGYGWETTRLLTNIRAVLQYKETTTTFNDSANGFQVFKCKIPIMIVPQILRHGQLSFMQQSERYTQIREYFYCDEFKSIISDVVSWDTMCYNMSQWDWDIVQKQCNIRKELTNKGSHGLAMTTLWIAGWEQDSNGLTNFFNVRRKKPAQKEVRELANAMYDMIYKE